MRRGERSKLTGQAWLFALSIPAAALFLLFSLLPYERMVEQWPLGITKEEVMAYQKVFDHRPGQHPEGHAETFTLERRGQAHWLVTDQGEAEVYRQEEPGAHGGFTLEYTDPQGHNGTFALRFTPADLGSMVSLYAHAVADSLPIISPSVQLVQLVQEGRKATPYLVQEVVDADYLEMHAPAGMEVWDPAGASIAQRRARNFPRDTIGRVVRPPTGDRLDTAAAAALAVLAWAIGDEDLISGTAGVLINPPTGRLMPVFQMHEGRPATANATRTFGQVMSDARIVQGATELADRLKADEGYWAQRLQGLDSLMVPVLAQGRHVGLIQAQVERTRERFLHRLFAFDPRFLGQPQEQQEADPIVLDPWLEPYRTHRDTIRFVRGKYVLDHDLVLPQGMAVVLERGTRWFVAPGVSVVVNGELHMRGTELNPVFIRPLDAQAPFGSIAVNGTGTTRVRINGLRISGGSGLLQDGVLHDGMLSFIGCDVALQHTAIGETLGAAAVHLAAGTVRMADGYLERASGAFVKMEGMVGEVRRCAFLKPRNQAEGLVLEASEILVSGCTIAGMNGDAIRVDKQGQVLVSQCRLKESGVALNIGHACEVWLESTEVSGNATAFRLRQENPRMPGALLELASDNTLFGNATERDVAGTGRVVERPRIGTTVQARFGLAETP